MRRLEQMQVREVKRKAPFRSQAQAGSWCQDVPNKEHVIGIAERSCTYNIIYCTAFPPRVPSQRLQPQRSAL